MQTCRFSCSSQSLVGLRIPTTQRPFAPLQRPLRVVVRAHKVGGIGVWGCRAPGPLGWRARHKLRWRRPIAGLCRAWG